MPCRHWRYDASHPEWDGLCKALAQDRSWVDYVMPDSHGNFFPRSLLEKGLPGGLPMLNFPEITMWEQWPWGGYGANPFPARLSGCGTGESDKLAGGFPYSEGILKTSTR